MPGVDLHIHSNFSDGELSPAEIAEEIKKAGITAFSVTDHDTIKGLSEAEKAAERLGLEFVPGVEISIYFDNASFHILAYYFEQTERFCSLLEELTQKRLIRAEKMIVRIDRLGYKLDIEDILKTGSRGSIGRQNIAQTMVKKGLSESTSALFQGLLRKGGPAYIPNPTIDPKTLFDEIHIAGGVAVLAHPGSTRHDEKIAGFAKAGLDGIEAYYCKHIKPQVAFYEKLARKYNLITTGGSDFHGKGRYPSKLGQFRVDYSILASLKERKKVIDEKRSKVAKPLIKKG
ncbi:phosphatase [bacterium]|nr:MAG: phosphatase [bacterium]